MKKLLIALLIMISLSLAASARSDEYDYKVVDGKMHIFGYTLESQYPIKHSLPEEDNDTFITINPSTSGRWIIIRTGYMEKTEMWLFDNQKKTAPMNMDFQPRGRHISIEWQNDEIFEIRHAGMGYWTSDFYMAEDLTKTFNTDFIMLYDIARDIYVSFYMDGIEIGKGFNRDNIKPERFNMDLEYEYLSEAMFTVKEVEIQDRKLIVTHRKSDGTLASETFTPAHLNESTLASAVEKSAEEMVEAILERMNVDEILNDGRGAMPTEYEYSFIKGCYFKVHSEWYGKTHGIIDDEIIPLGKVKIERLQEEGKYYFLFQCLEDEKCIFLKGDNTGEPYGGMRVQSIVPAGSSLDIFNQLKSYFEKLSPLCATDAEKNQISSIKPDEPVLTPGALPDIFRPLSWEMNIKELKKLFPSAEHFETTYTSPEGERMISSMVFGFKWDYFGEAHVGISHHNYERIDIISISTTERRPECFESLPAPEWCRTSYSDELVKTLEDLKKIITKAYGPPLEYVGGYREAAGLPPDSREKGNKWELDGYNLFLTITVGEEEDWAVSLQAVRRQDVATQEIGWIGLWNEEMTRWAENENQINSLCPKSMSQDSNEKCRKSNLAKKRWTIQAYKSPGNSSEKVGEILITVEPGSPFVASFKDNKGTIRDFEPDLYDQDWGYGPLIHQTLLEKKGDWLKIPIESLDTPLWINPKDNIKYLDIITIAEGHVYLLEGESIVITKIEGDTVSFRKEQPSDMWCYEGDPLKLNASEIKKINIKELYDSHKHLKLDIKYKRGC